MGPLIHVLVAFGSKLGATFYDARKIAVVANLEWPLLDPLREALGDMELMQRDDAALLRPHPEHFRVVVVLGHRKTRPSRRRAAKRSGGIRCPGGERSRHGGFR